MYFKSLTWVNVIFLTMQRFFSNYYTGRWSEYCHIFMLSVDATLKFLKANLRNACKAGDTSNGTNPVILIYDNKIIKIDKQFIYKDANHQILL